MDTKLTLRLDSDAIRLAKRYARQHCLSLSKMTERYFREIAKGNEKDFKLTPAVKELAGVLKTAKSFDFKKSYSEHLAEKHS